LENLRSRALKLKQLGAKITDNNDFDKDMTRVETNINLMKEKEKEKK